MSQYQLPAPGPGFPKIRWEQRPDGRFVAEWVVGLVASAPSLLPLALASASEVEVEISFPPGISFTVRLVSRAKSIQPEVYSVFYALIRPSLERGLITSIEGGPLEVHRYIIEGTARLE